MEAEVNNLKKGLDAIEELARNELGMIRNDEVFFQVLDNNKEESSQQREQ
ncbi:septum formation initiator family protein [Nitrosomonas nitrosa]